MEDDEFNISVGSEYLSMEEIDADGKKLTKKVRKIKGDNG